MDVSFATGKDARDFIREHGGGREKVQELAERIHALPQEQRREEWAKEALKIANQISPGTSSTLQMPAVANSQDLNQLTTPRTQAQRTSVWYPDSGNLPYEGQPVDLSNPGNIISVIDERGVQTIQIPTKPYTQYSTEHLSADANARSSAFGFLPWYLQNAFQAVIPSDILAKFPEAADPYNTKARIEAQQWQLNELKAKGIFKGGIPEPDWDNMPRGEPVATAVNGQYFPEMINPRTGVTWDVKPGGNGVGIVQSAVVDFYPELRKEFPELQSRVVWAMAYIKAYLRDGGGLPPAGSFSFQDEAMEALGLK